MLCLKSPAVNKRLDREPRGDKRSMGRKLVNTIHLSDPMAI